MIVEDDRREEQKDKREQKEEKTGSPLNLTLFILEAIQLTNLGYSPATSIYHSPYNFCP